MGDFEMTLGGGTPGTFATAEGAVALNGDVTIANSKTLSTGNNAQVNIFGPTYISDGNVFHVGNTGAGTSTPTASGSAGNAYFHGNVILRNNTPASSLTVHGDVTFKDVKDPGVANATFTTGTGAIQLEGDV